MILKVTSQVVKTQDNQNSKKIAPVFFTCTAVNYKTLQF